MKRNILLLLYIIFIFSTGKSQINLAILFDNSGSMKQFSKEQVEDAKKLITAFIFEGKYDSSKWTFSGDKSYIKKVWQDNSSLYLHAFGKLNPGRYPYFSEVPDMDTRSSSENAQRFIQKYLLNRITESEPFTNDLLAELVCWKEFKQEKKSGNLTIHMVKVWDGIPDPETAPVQSLKAEQTKDKPKEETIVLFQYNSKSKKDNTSLTLEYKIITTGSTVLIRTKQTDTSGGGNIETKTEPETPYWIYILLIVILGGILVYLKQKCIFPFNKIKSSQPDRGKQDNESDIKW